MLSVMRQIGPVAFPEHTGEHVYMGDYALLDRSMAFHYGSAA